ncbi:MAG: metallopeptidase family protein [Candidatus Thermoplasmatota archaeon]|nr:metallopeptidase family protein [Candidatus Thermoplasmatota archaeon]
MVEEKFQYNWEIDRYETEISYKMSDKVKEKVIIAFYKACKYGNHITLHIDDGCMGGGGDKIDYIYEIYDTWKNDDGDMYDFKGHDANNNFKLDNSEEVTNPLTGKPYFSSSRSKIFHYCLMAYYLKGSHKTLGSSDGPNVKAGYDVGDLGGDDITIFMGALGSANDAEVADVFMHELGHNLGLIDYYSNPDKAKTMYGWGHNKYLNYNNNLNDGYAGWQEMDLTIFTDSTKDLWD